MAIVNLFEFIQDSGNLDKNVRQMFVCKRNKRMKMKIK